jgi:hypothetical protein
LANRSGGVRGGGGGEVNGGTSSMARVRLAIEKAEISPVATKFGAATGLPEWLSSHSTL